jgi:hypothetical protein
VVGGDYTATTSTDYGTVWVYSKDSDTGDWNYANTYFSISDYNKVNTGYGSVISLYKNFFVVGADHYEIQSASIYGKVFVYTEQDGVFTYSQEIDAHSTQSYLGKGVCAYEGTFAASSSYGVDIYTQPDSPSAAPTVSPSFHPTTSTPTTSSPITSLPTLDTDDISSASDGSNNSEQNVVAISLSVVFSVLAAFGIGCLVYYFIYKKKQPTSHDQANNDGQRLNPML